MYYGTRGFYKFEPGSAYKRAFDDMRKIEEELFAKLNAEEKAMLKSLINATLKTHMLEIYDQFTLALRDGAKLMLEILYEEEDNNSKCAYDEENENTDK